MKCHYVGVDVGARELVVSIERDGTRVNGIVFPNDSGGHRKLIRWVTKKGATAHFASSRIVVAVLVILSFSSRSKPGRRKGERARLIL